MSYTNPESLIGTILPYGGSDIDPSSGWLMCDGREYNIDTNPEYKALWQKIGTSFGSSGGGTNFKVPDLRGMFMRGVDHSSGGRDTYRNRRYACTGGNAGNAIGSRQYSSMVAHCHNMPYVSSPAVCNCDDPNFNYPIYSTTDAWHDLQANGSAYRPRNIYVNFIIKF